MPCSFSKLVAEESCQRSVEDCKTEKEDQLNQALCLSLMKENQVNWNESIRFHISTCKTRHQTLDRWPCLEPFSHPWQLFDLSGIGWP